jgi:hypothetical protein
VYDPPVPDAFNELSVGIEVDPFFSPVMTIYTKETLILLSTKMSYV